MDGELKTPYKISLDFYIRKIITVNAKQLDTNSRIINITCTDNGKKVILDSATTSAFVRYKKSDGNEVLNEVPILDNGTVDLELSQQMLTVEGRQIVDIMLINGTELTTESVENILNSETMDGISVLSTMSFYINTEGCAIDGTQIESSYEYNALMDGLGKMVAVDQRITTLENTLNENEEQRQKDETTRQGNETLRQNAESERVETFAELVENANKATDSANQAANYATKAGDNTNAAIDRANQASDEVDELIAKYESIEDFSKIDEILNYKVEITQAEYDALSDEEKNNGKIYFITDANMGGTASEVSFDNTTSDLTSPNVQRAINEVNDKVNDLSEKTKDNTDAIVEKVDKSFVVNNLTSTEEGFVLDARQGKVLKDEIDNLASPQFAQLGLSTHITLASGAPVPFDQVLIVGDTFSVSNGIITVKKDINYVRVSATLGGSAASGRCWMRIMKNNTSIYDSLIYGDYFSPTGTVICSAKKGDTFHIYSNEEVLARSGGVGCYLSIEKIS